MLNSGDIHESLHPYVYYPGQPTKEVEKSGNSAKKAEGFWSKLGRSFKRIFLYRAIRKIISEIGQSAKEGLENVYEWSSAVGSMDVSETKSNLDRLSSSSLYLKNALGSALASALQIVTPYFDAISTIFIASTSPFLERISNSSAEVILLFFLSWLVKILTERLS